MPSEHDDRFPVRTARAVDESWKKYPRGAWIVFSILFVGGVWLSGIFLAALTAYKEGGVGLGTALELEAAFFFGLFLQCVLLWHFKPWKRGWL